MAERESKTQLEPFLKWPGGKRWLASMLCDTIRPELTGTYYEPFLGAGAVFLCLRPRRAVLSDVNRQLVECIRTASRCPHAVARALSRWSNTKRCYEQVRRARFSDLCTRAARFTYLTKTCWGGVYRVNKQGDFNVPFGGSQRPVYSEDEFVASAKAFRGAVVQSGDFEDVIGMARDGDVIYADPPYTTLGQNNGFLRYNEHLFAWKDQTRLAKASKKAARAGAFVVVSGLWHESVLRLYTGWWAVRVERSSMVSRTPKGRRSVTEALIFSRKPDGLSDTLNMERLDSRSFVDASGALVFQENHIEGRQ